MSNNELEMIARTGKVGNSEYFGGSRRTDEIVARGICSYCGRRTSFRQIGEGEESDQFGWMVPVRCDGCRSVISISWDEGAIDQHPPKRIQGLQNLPENVDKYYQEALRCISADAPNGATTLFRKTIHAVAIHYDLAEVDDSMGIYEMIKKLDDEGHINTKLRSALLAVKDIGNDGAHINKNEPDISQALEIKGLVDAVLESTILTDQRIEPVRDAHPNEFVEDVEDE